MVVWSIQGGIPLLLLFDKPKHEHGQLMEWEAQHLGQREKAEH